MRKLVSIRTVSEIRPIEKADLLEMAVIGGWQVVSQKNELIPGNLCVYFEIDSFLPIEERFEFLRKTSYRKVVDDEGFRLKTMKFRGQISQGLALPLKMFPELQDVKEGDDVTEQLKVIKWDPPLPPELAGVAKGLYPGFITKTDEERIQNLIHYFEEYKDVEFEISTKIDGTSCTYYRRDDEFGACSRNTEWLESESNTQWRLVKELDLKRRMLEYGRNLAIQGEIVGEGIQGNNERLKGQHYYVFNIFDIDANKYVDFEDRYNILDELNQTGIKIEHVPIIGIEKIFQKFSTIDEFLEYARGPSINPNRAREGLVFKSRLVDGFMISFKVISNKYLLKNDK